MSGQLNIDSNSWVGKNSIMEKNAKRKNTNGVKGHLNICRNVGGRAMSAHLGCLHWSKYTKGTNQVG